MSLSPTTDMQASPISPSQVPEPNCRHACTNCSAQKGQVPGPDCRHASTTRSAPDDLLNSKKPGAWAGLQTHKYHLLSPT